MVMSTEGLVGTRYQVCMKKKLQVTNHEKLGQNCVHLGIIYFSIFRTLAAGCQQSHSIQSLFSTFACLLRNLTVLPSAHIETHSRYLFFLEAPSMHLVSNALATRRDELSLQLPWSPHRFRLPVTKVATRSFYLYSLTLSLPKSTVN